MKSRITLLALIFAFLSNEATSQTQVGLGLGILKSSQQGTVSFLGGELYAKRNISDAIRMEVNFGFYTYSETTSGQKNRVSGLPISIGGEYLFLKDKFRPHLGISGGLMGALVSNSFGSGSDFRPFLSPKVGVDYHLSDNIGINANFKYNFVFYRDESTSGPDFVSTISPNIGVFYLF